MNRLTSLILTVAASAIPQICPASELLKSPNGKIAVSLDSDTSASWFLSIEYKDNDGKTYHVFRNIRLGIRRSDTSFDSGLKLASTGRRRKVTTDYMAVHGKRKHCTNKANEVTVSFTNPEQKDMNVTVRAYNDGICFRYEFDDTASDSMKVIDELTAYEIDASTDRWMQRFVTSYEGDFPHQKDVIDQGEWGYPALFRFDGSSCWALISEADIDRTYCATKLSNTASANSYKLTLPAPTDGNSVGDVNPTISLPWKSPWRTVIIGGLDDIVASTLIDDVSRPCTLESTDWIQPGIASWIYWAYNHGTKDYPTACRYVDLAEEMGWPYVLFDWEWDAMGNGGNIRDAVAYARSKGIKPLIWLNSGGKHNRVGATPRDLLITHESRMKTFNELKEMGIYGIKVDFFESDKQDMMCYYLDILEDAARFELMVNFHGSTVPRGWTRTYPHLMSMEAVYGAEQYNNAPRMTEIAPRLNATLPFTRNVIGPMDYTPTAFTNSQHPHLTSYAHELALPVVFESGIQHMADRPEGFAQLPEEAKKFLRHLPAAWDDTSLLDGYPGESVLMRREKGDTIYVAGINGTDKPMKLASRIKQKKGHKYQITTICDGDAADKLRISSAEFNGQVEADCLPKGGFVAVIVPCKK